MTSWGIGTASEPTYVLVRKDFYVPAGTTSATIQILVDNDVQVFLNGTDVSDGLRTHEGCANDSPVAPFVVNAPTLVAGVNKLAIIAKDRGGQSYFDVKVTLAP